MLLCLSPSLCLCLSVSYSFSQAHSLPSVWYDQCNSVSLFVSNSVSLFVSVSVCPSVCLWSQFCFPPLSITWWSQWRWFMLLLDHKANDAVMNFNNTVFLLCCHLNNTIILMMLSFLAFSCIGVNLLETNCRQCCFGRIIQIVIW